MILEFRKALVGILKEVADEVHYEKAPDTVPYPYIVYDLSELGNDGGNNLLDLEVNLLDYGEDTETVEILSEETQRILHRRYFINDEIQFNSYKLTRMTVPEDDKNIRRKRLTFEIQIRSKNNYDL